MPIAVASKYKQHGCHEDAYPDSCAADCEIVQHLLQNCLAVHHHHYQLVLTCQTPAASTDTYRQQTADWQTCKYLYMSMDASRCLATENETIVMMTAKSCVVFLSKLVGGIGLWPMVIASGCRLRRLLSRSLNSVHFSCLFFLVGGSSMLPQRLQLQQHTSCMGGCCDKDPH